MKSFNFAFAVLLIAGLSMSAAAQTGQPDRTDGSVPATESVKTESFRVWGKCGMCKTRIETTVKSEGASAASWDQKTQLLTVSYDPARTNSDALKKKLAAAGHDTEKYKAPDDVYSKLPACCHYERSK